MAPTSLLGRPASLRRELRAAWPFAALALVVFASSLLHRASGADTVPVPGWQKSYLELSVDEQRLYRSVREGLYDIENRRSSTGAWPEVAALVADEVPPFASTPLMPALAWSRSQQGPYVNYVGEPLEPDGGTRWLVLIIEPEPSALDAKAPPAPVDEEHHTLPSGLSLHVTVWTHGSGSREPTDLVRAFPVSDGWVQRVGQ